MQGSMNKFILSDVDQINEHPSTSYHIIDNNHTNVITSDDILCVGIDNESIKSDSNNNSPLLLKNNCDQNIEDKTIKNSLFDPALWPNFLSTKYREILISNGPVQIENINFPLNEDKRHFSLNFTVRTLDNGQQITRQWLIYSYSKDKAFCFCCKM